MANRSKTAQVVHTYACSTIVTRVIICGLLGTNIFACVGWLLLGVVAYNCHHYNICIPPVSLEIVLSGNLAVICSGSTNILLCYFCFVQREQEHKTVYCFFWVVNTIAFCVTTIGIALLNFVRITV